MGISARGESRTEQLAITNPGAKKAVAYVVVYAPTTEADRYDATYAVTVERLKGR